jgi:ABC-2 type transport system ATP-binding protein
MIGFAPQEIALYPKLTAAENLQFFGRIYGVKSPT